MDRREHSVTPIPLATWLLLAAAGIVLAVHVTADWYQLFGPFLIIRPEVIARALTATSPFLLGAAVVLGAVRWPAGRPWLYAGATALAVLGLLQLAFDIALALWTASLDPLQETLMERAFIAIGLLTALATVTAPLLLVAGLRAVRGAHRAWGWGTGVVMVLGSLAVASTIAPAVTWAVWSDVGDAASVGLLGWTHVGLGGAGTAAVVLLALAALRAAPRRGAVPELLIAIGATVGAVVLGWTAWFEVLAAIGDQEEIMRYAMLWNLAVAIEVIGVLCMAAGFVLGRVFPVPEQP